MTVAISHVLDRTKGGTILVPHILPGPITCGHD